MKKDLFNFSDFDDNIVNSIADNYPDMNKSQQKAICRKTRKRLIVSDDSAVGDVVSGIEPARKRSPWYICGTAAAAVFAIALIPTAFKALKNAPDGPENIQEPPVAVDMATAPVEDEEKSMAAVTTKIGKSDIIAEVTAPQPPTDETTTVLPTSPENPEKTKETEAPPSPPVTEGKRTTTKALRTTVPQAPPAPTSAPAVSTPVTTTKPVIVPPAPPAISEGDIFDMLANLSYRQETCDGIPDYTLQADDGTTYQILTGCNHVWRSGRSGYKEADITPEILEWIKKYGEPYKVKAHSATAEIDWSMSDVKSGVWDITRGNGYSALVRNTSELRNYLTTLYEDDKVEEYLAQYNDSYFKDYVLALNAVMQGGGIENKLSVSDLNMSDTEINITTEWHMNEVEPSVISLCLIKVNIPKYMYVKQDINWNINRESSSVDNQATAEIDWRYYNFIGSNDYNDGLVEGVWKNEYSDNWIITNTEELQNTFSDIYDENVIEEYREKYNDEFFDNNVLLLYLYCVPNGRDDKIYMNNIEISDSEININATYKITGCALLAPYVCVIHVTVPKNAYNEQEIYWNISEQFKIQ